ncbi:tail fiber domain-containing protein [Flavobacterium sp. MAH-1]|uniref:Tail fiber domain-containing protein n=1 Tax=Flavobacterium agri TaxID=2743471 RepID=A0A7Y8Y1J1_9FLAO|nr:tail fiber domain-containing protein [Flavobacterium agri]NUY80847.1 tail fiber domain-containing protein [Flavobacterium agri]NYA70871.1 tail fiber domain-containing protein [Flavobacterium agri]
MKTNFFLLGALFCAIAGNAQANYMVIGTATSPGNNNTLVGASSAASPPQNWVSGFTGTLNSAYGYQALRRGTTGSENTAVGASAQDNTTTGNQNTSVGRAALFSNQIGEQNVALGASALRTSIDHYNTGLGTQAGMSLASGSRNVFVGTNSGSALVTGTGNIFVGTAAGSTSSTNYSHRLYIDNQSTDDPLVYGEFDNRKLRFNVKTVGGSPFSSYVEINGRGGESGLKFSNLTSASTPGAALANGGVLSLNSTGDVILVKDTGITNSCTNNYNIPRSNGTTGNLACGIMWDNGSTVSLGTQLTNTTPVGYTLAGAPPFSGGTVAMPSGNLRFDVNGTMRTVGIFATSDKRFKKDITPIKNALETVSALNGTTYTWDKNAHMEMGFDNAAHSGFIAQELEKVLPHVVATDDKGNKSVNYLEVIPYLVEAIKEQQTQIEDLKLQISENFKAQNAELIGLTNTKIISVSPNPSKDVITVLLNIDKSAASAKLMVHDLKGTLVSSLNVNERDNNISKTFQKDNFGAGVYIVSLVVNGKNIDSKKIIFN